MLAIGQQPELSNQNAVPLAGEFSPALLQRLALIEIYSCRLHKKFPTLAHVDMKQWGGFSAEILLQGWPFVTVMRDGPSKVIFFIYGQY
jgi:hypothetical protein